MREKDRESREMREIMEKSKIHITKLTSYRLIYILISNMDRKIMIFWKESEN